MKARHPTAQGEELLRQLHVVRTRVRVLPARHPSVHEVILETHRLIQEMLREEKSLILVLRAGEAYLNGWRLPKESLRYSGLLEAFAELGIHSIQFLPGVPEAEFTRLIEACFVRDTTSSELVNMRAFLSGKPFNYILLNQDDLQNELTALPDNLAAPLAHAREVYQQAIRATVESQFDSVHGRDINVQFTMSIVDMLQDGLAEHPEAFFALSQLREFSEYTFYHSVNVAIISMLLGRGVGLDREAVRRLGQAAMLHDLGKVLVPAEVLEKPGRLDDNERAIIEAHPVDTVRILLEQKDLCPSTLSVAAQHHAQYNMSGYPDFKGFGPLHFFSHITAIADVYDALRSARSYKPAMLPDKAMEILLQGMGKQFHPALLKAFFRLVGFFPVGSAVELNTGELALVTQINQAAPLMPEIKIIGGEGNGSADRTVNLNTCTPFGDQPRKIVRSIDPVAYGIRIAEHL